MGLVIFAWLTTQTKFADYADKDDLRLASEVFRNELEDMNDDYAPVVLVDDGRDVTDYTPTHGVSFI